MSELSVNRGVDAAHFASTDSSYRAECRLMRAVANGEAGALEQLIEEYGESLATLIGRLMAWHDDCNDIFQEVLLAIWRQADRYQGTGSLEGWIKRIAINRCRNHFRAVNVFKRKLQQFATFVLIGKAKDQLHVFSPVDEEGCVQNEALDEALRQLPQNDRIAVVLFYLEGWSGQEVAEHLGLRVDTLHVRLHRIKKKLKSIIESS